jgi:hypothetical protein
LTDRRGGSRLLRHTQKTPTELVTGDDGLDRLLDLMDEARLLEIVDQDRPSVAPPRGLRRLIRRSKP